MLNDLLDMIFPDQCFGCGSTLIKGEKIICTFCHYELPVTDYHLNKDNELAKKFWGRINFKYAFAYLKFIKSGKVQGLLHALKYRGHKEIGLQLGRWYGKILAQHSFHDQFDLIIPVPLHPAKLISRGYNQAGCFAEGLCESLINSQYSDCLIRNIYTSTQTKKGRIDRWMNVNNIFTLHDPNFVHNKRVLLVDDVITTGATFEACAITLLDAGCKEISIAAIATA